MPVIESSGNANNYISHLNRNEEETPFFPAQQNDRCQKNVIGELSV